MYTTSAKRVENNNNWLNRVVTVLTGTSY